MPNGNGTRNNYEGNKKIGIYKGSWRNGNRNGAGKMNYTNGSIYNGLWKKDKMNGEGKLNYSNGDYYEGEYKDDNRKGKGKLHNSNGNYMKVNLRIITDMEKETYKFDNIKIYGKDYGSLHDENDYYSLAISFIILKFSFIVISNFKI